MRESSPEYLVSCFSCLFLSFNFIFVLSIIPARKIFGCLKGSFKYSGFLFAYFYLDCSQSGEIKLFRCQITGADPMYEAGRALEEWQICVQESILAKHHNRCFSTWTRQTFMQHFPWPICLARPLFSFVYMSVTLGKMSIVCVSLSFSPKSGIFTHIATRLLFYCDIHLF